MRLFIGIVLLSLIPALFIGIKTSWWIGLVSYPVIQMVLFFIAFTIMNRGR